MKKNKLNNKGFVLVETLIVSTFVMSIFSILYNNFYPLMGEYEKREVYDDIDGKYATFWLKQIIQDNSVVFTDAQKEALLPSVWTDDGDGIKEDGEVVDNGCGFFRFKCDMVGDAVKKQMCERIVEASEVRKAGDDYFIYITNYNLKDFKEKMDNGRASQPDACVERQELAHTGGMHKYVNYLPEYTIESLNDAKYRVIVEFYRTKDDNDYLAYSTFEVVK